MNYRKIIYNLLHDKLMESYFNDGMLSLECFEDYENYIKLNQQKDEFITLYYRHFKSELLLVLKRTKGKLRLPLKSHLFQGISYNTFMAGFNTLSDTNKQRLLYALGFLSTTLPTTYYYDIVESTKYYPTYPNFDERRYFENDVDISMVEFRIFNAIEIFDNEIQADFIVAMCKCDIYCKDNICDYMSEEIINCAYGNIGLGQLKLLIRTILELYNESQLQKTLLEIETYITDIDDMNYDDENSDYDSSLNDNIEEFEHDIIIGTEITINPDTDEKLIWGIDDMEI